MKFKSNQPSPYDKPIEDVLKRMEPYGPEDPEYEKQLTALERLTKLKRNVRPKLGISPDTAAVVAGNLLGILIIVAYEQKHSMTSKGMSYIKPVNPKN